MLTIDYILLTRPRVILLENVMGFRLHADYFGEERSGFDILQEKLDPLYRVGWSKMDLSVWLDCARPRLYIWLVAKDVGAVEDCEAIGRQIHLLESSRPERFRARAEDFMFQCSSEEWRERVLLGLQCRSSLAASRAAQTDTKGERKAQRHLLSLPRVEVGRLKGLQGTPRQQAMYQALVAARCADSNCDAAQLGPRAHTLKGFKWDFSQNLPTPSDRCKDESPVDNALRYAIRRPMLCLVRGSLPYSFEHDRLVLAEELLRSHGWQMGAKVPDCTGIKERDLQDLVGEMQAVQTLSVVLWSTLMVVAPRLSGLFAPA